MSTPPSGRVALQERIPKAELERLYRKERLSPEAIAQMYGVISRGIFYLLEAYGILQVNRAARGLKDQDLRDRDGMPIFHVPSKRPSPHGRGKLQRQVSKEDLVKLYHEEGLSLEDIAQKFAVTRPSVHNLLKQYGISTRNQSRASILAFSKGKFEGKSTANLRESLFSQWSQPMAYLLGYIFTDGTLGEATPEHYRLTISSIDGEHLEKLAAILGDKVRIATNKQSKKGFSGTEDRYIYSIALTRPEMMDDLRRLGLTERKSLTMQFPDVPEGFLRDFIRGCWDGDGSIFLGSHMKLVATFVTGSLAFIQRLRDRLDNRGFGCLTIYTRQPDGIKTKNPSYSVKITGNGAVKFCEFLYDKAPSNLFLMRKFLVYEYWRREAERVKATGKPT